MFHFIKDWESNYTMFEFTIFRFGLCIGRIAIFGIELVPSGYRNGWIFTFTILGMGVVYEFIPGDG